MRSITPRKLVIEFDDDIPRYWCHGSAFMTHMLNTYTLLIPDNENYYIRHLVRCESQISDIDLQRRLKDFCRQEAQHGVGHRAYWRNLDQLGIRYRGMVKLVGWFNYKLLEPLIPRKLHLANIACIEHINAYIGSFYLKHDLLKDADPRMRFLFNWHFAEEIEHSGVSFDVFQHVSGNYLFRLLAGLLVFPLFYLINSLGTFYLLGQDGKLLSPGTWRDLARFLFRYGAMSHALRNMLVYFKPGFHPSQVSDYRLVEAFMSRSEIREYLREFPSA